MVDKPFASLSSGLLARKGQARPAMRPQGFAGHSSLSGALEDLGWNDMGTDQPAPSPTMPALVPVTPATPAAASPMPPVLRQRAALRQEVETPEPVPVDDAEPVLVEVAEPDPTSAAEVDPTPALDQNPPAAVEPTPVAPSPPVPAAEQTPEPVAPALPAAPRLAAPVLPAARARADKAKAAFTLRIDRGRHLRLRLATAVTGRSAQVLMTEALDQLIAAMPELNELARQLPDDGKE